MRSDTQMPIKCLPQRENGVQQKSYRWPSGADRDEIRRTVQGIRKAPEEAATSIKG